ncbi:response regulator [Desulforhopalus sp. IMCC35007]|uniref:response regulator n=1 Tax=Desulforhopalus sp. IMCC35007 TaxID=2569543 RepID=UPI0010AE862A|nr:response regulator [Desulforhopalus sp. IMCC35007]TKB09872.1 response regulator [Desulforhopalus sp. IMCC35007]
MEEIHKEFKEKERDILEYLRSLRLLSSDLDVEVTTIRYSGLIQVRGGAVGAARQGALTGNGALFTLLSQRKGEVKAMKSTAPLVKNVTVNHEQMAHICTKILGNIVDKGACSEEQLLEEAIHLFLQFRKKEAGIKLVEILRCNRFYYPAWLWHSRQLNQVGYLTKALDEMKKWGGHDLLVKQELAKLGPRLSGKEGIVKRCIFCWAIVEHGQEQCENCHCLLTVSSQPFVQATGQKELEDSVHRYEEEFKKSPRNSRIAYCLCLGMFSLGKTEQAKEYLERALAISPGEPLFVKTMRFLTSLLPSPPAPRLEKKAMAVQAPVVNPCQPPQQKAIKESVLVIEDSNTSRKVITMVLKRHRYSIVEATTGGEGLARMLDIVPDLVLLDVMLPDMDGYQVLSEIRATPRLKDVPVVMLTGKRGSADRMKGIASGANEYLTKPFDPAKLLNVLKRFIGTGSKKTFTVPVKKPVIARGASPIKKPASRVVESPVTQPVLRPIEETGPSILIVEDSPTTQKVISMVLGRKGYTCRRAISGVEAIQSMRSHLPDLVLLDAVLPDMDGYSVLFQMQQIEKMNKVPVVMLTAKTSATDRQKGMASGAKAYLTKPFDPDKLLSTVAQYAPVSSSATKIR